MIAKSEPRWAYIGKRDWWPPEREGACKGGTEKLDLGKIH